MELTRISSPSPFPFYCVQGRPLPIMDASSFQFPQEKAFFRLYYTKKDSELPQKSNSEGKEQSRGHNSPGLQSYSHQNSMALAQKTDIWIIGAEQSPEPRCRLIQSLIEHLKLKALKQESTNCHMAKSSPFLFFK